MLRSHHFFQYNTTYTYTLIIIIIENKRFSKKKTYIRTNNFKFPFFSFIPCLFSRSLSTLFTRNFVLSICYSGILLLLRFLSVALSWNISSFIFSNDKNIKNKNRTLLGLLMYRIFSFDQMVLRLHSDHAKRHFPKNHVV